LGLGPHCRFHTPIIPETEEAEIGRIATGSQFEASEGKKKLAFQPTGWIWGARL
jgi:hypothetical protein